MKNQNRASRTKVSPVKGQVRSGDVLLNPVAGLPAGAKLVEEKRDYVLALGEATGHSHTLTAPSKVYITDDGRRFVLVEGAGLVEHEEHVAVPVRPGLYEVIPEKELTLEGEWQKSVD